MGKAFLRGLALLPLVFSGSISAQVADHPMLDQGVVDNLSPEAAAPEGPSLGEFIGSIAEKSDRSAVDYEQIAQMTLQLGQAALQQQQRIPDESIWDGIYAVDAGKAINPAQTDWDTLRTELEKLLEKPPEQDQQQPQDQQNPEDQNPEDQENQDSQSQSGNQNSGQEGNEGSEGQNNSEQDPQQQDGENSDSQNEESPDGEPQDPQNGGEQNGSEQQKPGQNLGDMESPEQSPELDQQRPAQEEPTQEVGGTPKQSPIRSAKQAMTLQQLEQIKQQDKPGALHMLLQQAEQDGTPPPKTLQKDW